MAQGENLVENVVKHDNPNTHTDLKIEKMEYLLRNFASKILLVLRYFTSKILLETDILQV